MSASIVPTIARKEFRELVRDGRFRAAGAAVLALLVGALLVSFRSTSEIRTQHEDATRLTREHWVNQPAKSPHSAAHYGVYAFKPKTALAFIDEGVDPFTGVAAYLEAHVQNDFTNRPAADATALQRFGTLTAATVLQVLIPLLIIVLAAGAMAGEREAGTLRLLLSLGVAPAAIGRGKILGIGAALLALLTPAALLGVGSLIASGELPATGGRFAVMVIAYLASFAVWIGLALAISARAPSTRASLLALLGLWMLNTLVVPRATTDLVRRIAPTPSALELQRRLRQEQQAPVEGQSYDEHLAVLQARVLARYGVDSVSKLPLSFAGIALDASEQWGDRVFDRVYGRMWDAFERQETIRQWVGIAFPLLALRGVSQGLAGTDVRHHRAFATAAEQYRRTLVKTMNDEMRDHAAGQDFQYLSDVAVWQKVPPFQYQAPGLAEVAGRHGAGFGALGLWVLLALGFAFGAARRVSP